MFNAKEILGQLMQSSQGMSAPQSGAAEQGSLLGGIGGLLKNPAVTGALSGAGGGLLAGLLLSNKKVRSVGGKVAAVGGAAALGAIALKAYQNWQGNRGNTQTATASAQTMRKQPQQNMLDFNCMPEQQQEDHSRAMLAAIVAAAKADGHFDSREQQLIQEQITKLGDAETTAWVQQEIRKPLDAARIAAMATSPELASEIYLASLMVIDEQNEHEKAYLNSLAKKLGLDPQLRLEIEQQLAQAGT
ncbi:MAG: tellurite resistance TerB family protein [Bacteroidales bacterium]|jgi:uncharacterized membrane protein YebE (DUF533 family)|nr:tellurite resistance TerB family protein [Bacteroidales bacterium]